jgi:carboxyl-terminal processing protease
VRNTTRVLSILLLAFLSVAAPSCASNSTAQRETTMTEARRAEHVASFEYVWESIKQKHWDPDLNGVDWDQAREDLLPIVENAQSDAEARGAMNALLERLGQSHFGIIPGSAYEDLTEVADTDLDSDTGSGEGWTGIDARLIDGEFLITRVHEGSPANRAKIEPGSIITAIEGRETARIIDVVNAAGGIQRPETTAGMIVQARLAGSEGATRDITIIGSDGDERTVTLTLDEAPGVLASFGELPPTPVVIESKTLEDGVGYFRFSIFLDPPRVLPAFQQFVKEHMDAPGIIIDVRGNPGGIILMAPGMINWLISEKGLSLGTMRMRDAQRGPFDIPLVFNPRRNAYQGKVAVLTDEMSVSNSEILAAGLKDIGRAKVYGTRTAGLVLPSTVERLPNGDGFQYAFASYETSGGYSLEGQGAIPDVEIRPTREELLMGRDPVLEAAESWILSDD